MRRLSTIVITAFIALATWGPLDGPATAGAAPRNPAFTSPWATRWPGASARPTRASSATCRGCSTSTAGPIMPVSTRS